MDVLERHLDMVKTYTQAADYITCHIESGAYYKKSSQKSEVNIEFLPVNFHVQRLSVRNVSTRKRKFTIFILSLCTFSTHTE